MADTVLFILIRILLPFTLIIVSLVRPVGISYFYLILFFVSPWLHTKSLKQQALLNVFVICLCAIGTLCLIGHLLINLINLFFIDLSSKKSITSILRQIGFLYFKGLSFGSIAHWILPDIFVLLETIVYFIYSKVYYKRQKKLFLDDSYAISKESKELRGALKISEINRQLIIVYIQSVLKTSPFFTLIVIYFAATLRPSLPGSLYFLMFIIAGTYWALYRQLHRGMYYPLIFMIVALLVHVTCLFAFQLSVLQQSHNYNSIWTRFMGMEVLIYLLNDNNNGKILEINSKLNFDSYLSPIALMLAYFASTRNLINRSQYELRSNTIRMNLVPKPYDDIYANSEPLKEKHEEILAYSESSMLEQFFYMVFDITSFIYKNSYILLNVIMMIWSIVYHSWLTFVLLIWANILWMIPNQRRSMMRSSFFVVLYAQILLITQYVYGMNIYESELPTKVTSCGVNLEQVGFVHPQNEGRQPWIPLTVKTGFLFVFWITSRQYFKEKAEHRTQSDLLQQIFGPHHLRSEQLLFERSRAPQLIIFLFKSTSNFITRIWMWLLIFLIFLCAMIDRTMTGFRICYMSLFLLFLMVFQMSLQLWIKFLYGFWMFLIFYAMTILTVIYTYQFDHFDYYWETFLKVQPTLQSDIGLRRYQTKDLFLHLLIPTLTVIFTVVQLHYFHRRFMESVRRPRPYERQNRGTHLAFIAEVDTQTKVLYIHRQSWKVFFYVGFKKLRAKGRRLFSPGKLFTWGFLETHMIKAVILACFYCAISEVCFLNIFLVVLSLLSICVNRFVRRFIFRAVTFWISVLVLMKMIYQIKYLDQNNYNYKCKNITVNFAEWMGLRKTGKVFGIHLRYISPYIVYMIVTSLHAVVKLRDHLIRYSTYNQKDRNVLFPDITRQDAERDFPGLLKYVFNYGFFKFGLEITLIGLVSTIAHRRDILALTYLIWLILLLCLNRVQCARIWEIFQLYFVVSIFVQYMYLLNFPPNICDVSRKASSLWIILGKNKNYKSTLMLDYILLLLISRQRKSFRVEMRHIKDLSYRGGDNINVVNNIARLGHVFFENPTHDFCSYVRNYADVFKTAIFCSFFWITLAVVFLGGVCSMDILSLGYIIFALVFLLQGSEVYLQNIHYIICRWNCLIAFNIFNIIVKSVIIVLEDSGIIYKESMLSVAFNVMHQRASFEDVHVTKVSEINELKKKHEKYNYGPNNIILNNTLVWHAIIFSFVIFQRRIFCSYYFCHVIMDTQANTILASRGAAVIDNLHYKQIYDRREYEKNVLESVKDKMERIRANNQKNIKQVIELDSYHQETPLSSIHVHYKADEEKRFKDLSSASINQAKLLQLKNTYLTRTPEPRRRDLRLHPHAVRTGDYYMFEEFNDDDDMDVYEEYDFLEKEDLRARQMRLSLRFKSNKMGEYHRSKSFLHDGSSDSDNKDLDTHPVIKLTAELIVLLTFRLNRLSRNYRFVHKVLSAEKKTLQEISTMNRLGLSNSAAMFKFLNQSLSNKPTRESGANSVTQDEDFTSLDHNDFVQMLIALWYALIANTEAICYLAVFLNQAANSSMISLPMPFLVLCWGSLTLPRPTKTFWVTLITYSLAMIFLKSIMHQRILLDQQFVSRSNTLSFELIMKHGKAVYDLFLLVVLFWHRYMLKKQGIWTIQRTNSELLLLEKNQSSLQRSDRKERPEDIRELLSYMEIPFLYILRTMLDWVCIDTTLTVMEWIKMEDIFQSVFIVRCYRQMDTDFPVLRGEPKALYAKLLIGGTIILVLIALIWSPLFLFALVGTVGKPNIPRKADIVVKISHYEPFYVSQTYSGIHTFSDADFQELNNRIIMDNNMIVYDAVDITAIKFYENSITLWNMSPPDKLRLLYDLKSGKPLQIHLTLSLKCNLTPEAVIYETTYTLTNNKVNTREKLIRIMSSSYSNEKVIIPNILPKFITVQKQQANAKFIKDYDGKFTRPVILKKNKADNKEWWEMYDYCDDSFYTDILSALPQSNCKKGVVLYIFNDKSFPSAMSFLEKTGIIGLYTTFVYVVSRVIRSLIANNHRRIMFEDLPYVDRVLRLCNDIYLVRETHEYRLEEDLYGKLIFLYRSPETLIKWTRFKEDFSDTLSSSQLSIGRTQAAP
ncbi:piezo-type mechanosensitive ion channel component isoform X3 [Drosophila subpulchrella]|uniref:piezo-type mechanosensitive ion channel component isoform X3 n=1 Tax=Drosophila subpulchrella TaxID=1486046 RepID=UPI0018A174F2|nr:piezo-type mechanosensitive ion channel component isoform X3 [Drosophila subpulchrella]